MMCIGTVGIEVDGSWINFVHGPMVFGSGLDVWSRERKSPRMTESPSPSLSFL